MQTRLQNFDDDSDDGEYEPKLSVRQVSDRRASRLKPTDQNTREDSHDENDDNILAGNLLNAHKDSLYIAKSDTKPVIRGGPARRVNSKPAAAGTAGEAGPARGFVPRDLSSKVKRNTSSSNTSSKLDDDQSSRNSNHDDNGEDNEVAPWTKVPKKFLREPAPVESTGTSTTRYDTSKLPMPSKGRSESYTINNSDASPGSSKAKKSFSKPSVGKATYRRPKEQDFEADSNSEPDELDSKSVESSNTVEEFDAGPTAKVEKASSAKREEPARARPASRQPPGKPMARAQEPPRQQANHHNHHQQSSRLQDSQRREQERDFEIEGEEDDEDNDYDPTVMKDGEYYTDYVQRSQAMAVPPEAVTRPNKSGRYEDNDADADSTNWMASGSNRAVTSSRDNSGKTSWASVRPPANNAVGGASEHSPSSRFSFVMVAHARGVRTEHVQCTVIRDRRASINGKLHPTYELILEETNKPILMAQKMNLNRTSNYHLFDLTRAQLSSKLSKKSGNYLGKLRAKNVNRTEYVLLNQNSEREEIAGVRFERVSLMNQLLQQESNQPRKMKIMVPPIDANGIPIPNRTADSDAGSLAEKLSEYEATALGHGSKDLHVFESKDPEFVNGNFRLNFHGRVSKPSVKNFQMVSRENIDDVICQFGKVDEDVFHLDFKAPINACQAFAFALCQFNL